MGTNYYCPHGETGSEPLGLTQGWEAVEQDREPGPLTEDHISRTSRPKPSHAVPASQLGGVNRSGVEPSPHSRRLREVPTPARSPARAWGLLVLGSVAVPGSKGPGTGTGDKGRH